MTLRLLVLLAVLAVLGRRFLPRQPISWALPVVLGVTILVVRGVAYLVTDEGGSGP